MRLCAAVTIPNTGSNGEWVETPKDPVKWAADIRNTMWEYDSDGEPIDTMKPRMLMLVDGWDGCTQHGVSIAFVAESKERPYLETASALEELPDNGTAAVFGFRISHDTLADMIKVLTMALNHPRTH